MNYYELLMIKKTATKEEIEVAYKKMIREYHPDINKSTLATKLSQELNSAREVLMDDTKRKNYDQETFGYTQTQESASYESESETQYTDRSWIHNRTYYRQEILNDGKEYMAWIWLDFKKFINNEELSFIYRSAVGLVLVFWLGFMFLVRVAFKIVVFIAYLLSSVMQLWCSIIGGLVLLVTIAQMAGANIPFWQTHNLAVLIIQIVLMVGIVLFPLVFNWAFNLVGGTIRFGLIWCNVKLVAFLAQRHKC